VFILRIKSGDFQQIFINGAKSNEFITDISKRQTHLSVL